MRADAVPRVLGLDIGRKRIGLALSDPLGLTAGGLGVLERGGSRQAVAAIADLVTRHQVKTVVVGLPLTLRGSRGAQAQRVQSFAALLARAVEAAEATVVFMDERLTTAQGHRALIEAGVSRKRRKESIDQAAAQLILQSYLDKQRDASHE